METHLEENLVIEIPLERLRYLEALEASLTERIDLAVKEYKANSLKRLHEKDKLNPSAVNARAKRYAEKHREELNAKRRAKRQEEKAKKESFSLMVKNDINIVSTLCTVLDASNTTRINEKIKRNSFKMSDSLPSSPKEVTVHFN